MAGKESGGAAGAGGGRAGKESDGPACTGGGSIRPTGAEAARPGTGAPAAADMGLPEHVTCPFCDQKNTKLHSSFGGALSMATYWCNKCRTSFEWIK